MCTFQGRREDNGEGPGADAALREEIHADEGEHPGRLVENSNVAIAERHGAGDARRHQGHAEHEPPAQPAADTEDPAGVRKAVGDHGHEGGDHERRHRRRDGRWRRSGRKVGNENSGRLFRNLDEIIVYLNGPVLNLA